MQCPVCDSLLSEVTQSGIAVDMCRDGCGGIWFDNQELERILRSHEPSIEKLLEVSQHRPIEADRSATRTCPRCPDRAIQRHYFSVARQVEVDTCYQCGGVWLDAADLRAVRGEYATKEERRRVAEAWSQEYDQRMRDREQERRTQDAARRRAGDLSFEWFFYMMS